MAVAEAWDMAEAKHGGDRKSAKHQDRKIADLKGGRAGQLATTFGVSPR